MEVSIFGFLFIQNMAESTDTVAVWLGSGKRRTEAGDARTIKKW